MGNALVAGGGEGGGGETGALSLSESIKVLKENVQKQMKELKLQGKLTSPLSSPKAIRTSRGTFSSPTADSDTNRHCNHDDSSRSGQDVGTGSEEKEEKEETEAKQGDEKVGGDNESKVEGGPAAAKLAETSSDSAAAAALGADADNGSESSEPGFAIETEQVPIQVPRNLARILGMLESRVAALEHTVSEMHTAQTLGDEAIDTLLRANPRSTDPGVPYFVFDALDVPLDDDPFPALSQRPVQVLRVRDFVMQEDRTARLIKGLKAPQSAGMRELHFVNCEWDLIQAQDVATAVREAGLRISTLNLSRSQKLRGDSFAGFANAFEHLRTIDLENCQHIDDASFGSVAKNCRGLLVVNVNNCFKLTDKTVEALMVTNKQLHDARLTRTSISDKALTSLATAGSHLRRLEVACCKTLTNAGLEVYNCICYCPNNQML